MGIASIKRGAAAGLGLTVVLTGGPAGATPAPAPLSRVSVSSAEAQANQSSDGHHISANGRYVSFASSASNLVPGDTNGTHDVFVRDLRSGSTTRVSVSGRGAQADGQSLGSAISADGRYVAFASGATNLVPGDTNATYDVFVRDRLTRKTVRVSVSSRQGQGNGFSNLHAISPDGRYVLFGSNATNLVPGTDANGGDPDVFVRDLLTRRTVRVNVSTEGVQSSDYSSGVAISAGGRYVAFTSQAPDLVPGDTNGSFDAFVRDRLKGTTTRVSLPTGPGGQGDGHSFARAMSADGRYVAFESEADNLVPGDTNNRGDIFLRDRRTGTTTRVSLSGSQGQAADYSTGAAMSANGRYVAFATGMPGDTNQHRDVFVRDRRAGTTTRISVSATGAEGDGQSLAPSMSADGRSVVFFSEAANLLPGDTNGALDVFLWRAGRR